MDNDWALLPNPCLVPYGGEIIVGYEDGSSWRTDEYGRSPGDPQYDTRDVSSGRYFENCAAWAAMRAGRSLSRTVEHEFGREFYDKYIEWYRRSARRVGASDSALRNR
jgi:hypothetical protein